MMTRSLLVTAAAAVTVLAACGPTARQVRDARDAQYNADRHQVIQLTAAAVAKSYDVSMVDEESGTIMTVTRWHEHEGNHLDVADRENGTLLNLPPNAVSVGFRVTVVGDLPPFRVIVEPGGRVLPPKH
jgi:hypothetical protein